MTTSEFLNFVWQEIELKFPDIIIEYEFDHTSNNHFIKVSPQSTYDSKLFMRLESKFHDLWDEIEKSNVEEDVCFLSDDSLIQLKTPEIIYRPEPKGIKILVPDFDHQEKIEAGVIDPNYYNYADLASINECLLNEKFAMAA
jgi:hypothetical protein